MIGGAAAVRIAVGTLGGVAFSCCVDTLGGGVATGGVRTLGGGAATGVACILGVLVAGCFGVHASVKMSDSWRIALRVWSVTWSGPAGSGFLRAFHR
eukprot:CAMPEP_0113626920 /NCGR_PEP_ID=MMETSP0017_2-20120614/13932_1 /TAXON_ID=2856 /ORGANISM="Cylindrotheca closterium" /LENGTH=96 /DNA_ID=CAMNT_0000537137 /DNA_START=155 /DNA_END=445 /DNA_ORIENTATION=- /assembly_acc=CAM_ASM_000147